MATMATATSLRPHSIPFRFASVSPLEIYEDQILATIPPTFVPRYLVVVLFVEVDF
jgi:hypothetical protein